MEYKRVTQKVLFANAVLVSMMSVRKHDVIPQNGDCSRESNVGSHGNPDNNLESLYISIFTV
jgi:hypothetical protein